MTKIIDHFNEGVDFEKLFVKDVALKFCVLYALKNAIGQENRLTRDELVAAVKTAWYYKIGPGEQHQNIEERKVRETVRQLRKEGAGIMSTGGTKGGYWKDDSIEGALAFVDNEFTSRALDMLHTGKRVIDARRRQQGGQMSMWKELTIKSQKYQQAINLLED